LLIKSSIALQISNDGANWLQTIKFTEFTSIYDTVVVLFSSKKLIFAELSVKKSLATLDTYLNQFSFVSSLSDH